ncbi:30S ribosomal protein S27ae [Candidatus Woesearchaeota archaeon]|nr:30S ribosomal protein S27ae [Candidatus Woesearchaeota archaeon]
MGKGPKVVKKGKKTRKPKKTSAKYKHYTASGDKLERKKKFCPKCGVGVFLSEHKDRLYCGQCHYTEFTGKK